MIHIYIIYIILYQAQGWPDIAVFSLYLKRRVSPNSKYAKTQRFSKLNGNELWPFEV